MGTTLLDGIIVADRGTVNRVCTKSTGNLADQLSGIGGLRRFFGSLWLPALSDRGGFRSQR